MRLFFGIELPWQTRLAIDCWRETAFGLSAPPIPGENLHITLAFLGELEASCIEQLDVIAQSVARETFEFSLTLNQIGCFIKPGILWVGPTETDGPLDKLAKRLRKQLAREGFRPDNKVYIPHVTLWRRLDQHQVHSLPVIPPHFEITIDQITLFESCLHPQRNSQSQRARRRSKPSKSDNRPSRVSYRPVSRFALEKKPPFTNKTVR